MPSGTIKIVDPAITRGMNTIDDPKILKPGECVRLLNAFPGDPPTLINGSSSVVIKSTNSYRFVPPGISIKFGSTVYIIAWAQYGTDKDYHLLVFDKDTTGYEYSGAVLDGWLSLGFAEFFAAERTPIFDFIELFSCVYASIPTGLSEWLTDTKALGHKVVESNLVVRDMCIGAEASVASVTTTEVNGGIIGVVDYCEYAFQFVRRNDLTAFEGGSTPSGMILPAGIPATYQPKRMDTFLPGSCIGIETIENRIAIVGASIDITPTAGLLSQSGLGSFNPSQCVDYAEPVTVGFNVDAATPGAYLKIDYGAGQTRNISVFDIRPSLAGCVANFSLQYSDDDTTWVDAKTGIIPNALQNVFAIPDVSAHRYWRLYLTNTPGAGPDINDILVMGRLSPTITILSGSSHAVALAQGATHLRVSRSLFQTSEVLAQGATKFFLCDLPLNAGSVAFQDTTSNAALEGEANQLITGYSVAPQGAFFEYVKGRLFIMDSAGKVYYSESPGGDGGTDLASAEAYPQAWASLFKPLTDYLDCDYADGQKATGMKRIGNDLYMFKERKIFALYGGNPNDTAVTQLSQTVGCAFPYTLTLCESQKFGRCLLFLSSTGPMVLLEGGRLQIFAEMKIKELWPDYSTELYGNLTTDYEWIIQNTSAKFFKNAWWVMYIYRINTEGYNYYSKVFGFYIDPSGASEGPFEFKFADMTTSLVEVPTGVTPVPDRILFKETTGEVLFKESTEEILFIE